MPRKSWKQKTTRLAKYISQALNELDAIEAVDVPTHTLPKVLTARHLLRTAIYDLDGTLRADIGDLS